MKRSSAPLELQSDCVHDVHIQRHQQASRALVPAARRNKDVKLAIYVIPYARARVQKHHAPQRRRGEAHRATDVHGVAEHVEREPLDAVVHQDTEVVSQERARDAKCPRRAHDERLARDEKRRGQESVERSGEQWHAGLFEERASVSAGGTGIGELSLDAMYVKIGEPSGEG